MEFTIVRKSGPKALMTKVFDRAPDGQITKDSSHCSMSTGVARRVVAA